MAGVEDNPLRDPVLLCDLCVYEDLGKAHSISALSSVLWLTCVRMYFPGDVPLITVTLLASLPFSLLLPPQPSPTQPNPVGKSLSLGVTDRTRNMPGMVLCQLDREHMTGLETVKAETWHSTATDTTFVGSAAHH